MKTVKNPHNMCIQLHSLVESLVSQLKEKLNSKEYDPKGLHFASSLNFFFNFLFKKKCYAKFSRFLGFLLEFLRP